MRSVHAPHPYGMSPFNGLGMVLGLQSVEGMLYEHEVDLRAGDDMQSRCCNLCGCCKHISNRA